LVAAADRLLPGPDHQPRGQFSSRPEFPRRNGGAGGRPPARAADPAAVTNITFLHDWYYYTASTEAAGNAPPTTSAASAWPTTLIKGQAQDRLGSARPKLPLTGARARACQPAAHADVRVPVAPQQRSDPGRRRRSSVQVRADRHLMQDRRPFVHHEVDIVTATFRPLPTCHGDQTRPRFAGPRSLPVLNPFDNTDATGCAFGRPAHALNHGTDRPRAPLMVFHPRLNRTRFASKHRLSSPAHKQAVVVRCPRKTPPAAVLIKAQLNRRPTVPTVGCLFRALGRGRLESTSPDRVFHRVVPLRQQPPGSARPRGSARQPVVPGIGLWMGVPSASMLLTVRENDQPVLRATPTFTACTPLAKLRDQGVPRSTPLGEPGPTTFVGIRRYPYFERT